jgi:uncharacterized protein YlxP (DUF503 family)
MNVGLCVLEIHLSSSHSLKDKRRVLKGLKDRLRGRFNVSVAEIDHQDLWQRATLGIVSISGDRQPIESCFGQIRRIVESELPAELVAFEVEYLT